MDIFTQREQYYFLKGLPIIYTADNILKLQQDLAVFLDHTRVLLKLEKAVEKFRTTVEHYKKKRAPIPPFKCVIPVDLILLHDKAGKDMKI